MELIIVIFELEGIYFIILFILFYFILCTVTQAVSDDLVAIS